MPNVQNVTYGKAKMAGAVYCAPAGTPLPTDTTTELNEAFKELGFVSDAGLVNNNTAETNQIRAWGGSTVMTTTTGKPDTFAFTLLEVLNVDVLKAVYGEQNVTGDIDTGITVKANTDGPVDAVYVIDIQMRNGRNKRIVIPQAALQEVGEVSYTDGEATGYPITLLAQPDKDGNTHFEYIK